VAEPVRGAAIGSVRHECLDHVVVLGERHLRRIVVAYFDYYHRARTHLSLDKDAPDGRSIEPPGSGTIISVPEVGGLHHRYVRQVA
jgi:putative transposase